MCSTVGLSSMLLSYTLIVVTTGTKTIFLLFAALVEWLHQNHTVRESKLVLSLIKPLFLSLKTHFLGYLALLSPKTACTRQKLILWHSLFVCTIYITRVFDNVAHDFRILAWCRRNFHTNSGNYHNFPWNNPFVLIFYQNDPQMMATLEQSFDPRAPRFAEIEDFQVQKSHFGKRVSREFVCSWWTRALQKWRASKLH